MKCEECRELLWIYLEWKTLPEESAEIKAHLASCPECRRTAAAQMSVLETLRSLPEAELPEGWHAELMQKIAAEAPAAAMPPVQEEKELEQAGAGKVTPIPIPIEQKDIPKKQPRKKKWKQWSLVAAAALLIGAAGGLSRVHQETPEAMQLTAERAGDGGETAELRDMPMDMALDIAAAELETVAENAEPAAEAGADERLDLAAKQKTLAEQENIPAPASLQAESVPEQALAAPRAAASAGGAVRLQETVEMVADRDAAEEGAADDTTHPAAVSGAGDSLTLRMEHGGNAYSFISRAVERTAGFEESADGAIQVMIPVENVGIFYEELGKFGEIEWQAQGAEEAGAMYRRVRIQVETE